MATGTGKTYTAFQIIWRLWKAGARNESSSSPTATSSSIRPCQRLWPFGQAMAKISTTTKTIEGEDGSTAFKFTTALNKNRRIDTSYEIYLLPVSGRHRAGERKKI